MNITISSIFPEAGYNFNISYKIHEIIASEINEALTDLGTFDLTFGKDFDLGIIVSTKRKVNDLYVQGPAIFKREKIVDFTIWIPFREVKNSSSYTNSYIDYLIKGILELFERYDIDTTIDKDFIDRIKLKCNITMPPARA
ncbi:MAG: hypothetical protein AAF849_07645 [Bacteroidota bacterium]